MTNESWIPVPSRPTPLATTENLPPIRSHRTFKTYPYQIGTQRKRSCKTNFNKNLFFFIRVVFNGPPPLPQLGLWTFAFSPRFSFPLRPRSFFPTRQRFPISNPYQIHIWTIYGSRTTPDASIGLVPYQTHIKSIYGPYMGHPRSPNWTLDFAPAFSPRFSFPLSPRSFFHTRQRFPISNHVTSGCMSPRSSLDHWSAVSHTGNDMTSLICSRPIRSQHFLPTGPLYY